jgi:hypothetical protein
VSLARTAAQNVNHELLPLQDGVAGWVVLGAGITEELVARYTTPRQTMLSQRCARAYRPLPVTSLRKLNNATGLEGVVRVTGQSPVVATPETATIDGEEVPAIVFRLVDAVQNFNSLVEFQGPCAQRPESGTCPKPPIETINGIRPDCNGNINIVFDGFQTYAYDTCGGVDVLSDLGLAAACAQGEPKSRRVVQDECYPSQSLSEGDDTYWSPPYPPIITVSESLPAEQAPDRILAPYETVNFSSGSATPFFTKTGLFVFDQVEILTQASFGSESAATATETVLAYTTADILNQNIAIYYPWLGYPFQPDRPIDPTSISLTALLSIGAGGPRRNGGLILFYPRQEQLTAGRLTYFAAALDADRNKLQLVRWNGSRFVIEYETDFEIYVGSWYELTVIQEGAVITVSAQLEGAETAPVTFTIAVALDAVIAATAGPTGNVSDYGPAIFSDQSYTHFRRFFWSEI